MFQLKGVQTNTPGPVTELNIEDRDGTPGTPLVIGTLTVTKSGREIKLVIQPNAGKEGRCDEAANAFFPWLANLLDKQSFG